MDTLKKYAKSREVPHSRIRQARAAGEVHGFEEPAAAEVRSRRVRELRATLDAQPLVQENNFRPQLFFSPLLKAPLNFAKGPTKFSPLLYISTSI